MRRSNVIAFTGLLCAFSATPAGAALSFVQNFGSPGSGIGQSSDPGGVHLDSAGNVYVGDFGNSRVVRFNPSNFATSFTSFGIPGKRQRGV